jgi:hypothetical protein
MLGECSSHHQQSKSCRFRGDWDSEPSSDDHNDDHNDDHDEKQVVS